MRLVALLILLASAHSWAVPMSQCTSGGYVPTANYPGWCPTTITPLSTSVTDTTVTVTGTVSAATGTSYGSITLGACGTRRHPSLIVSGAGDESSQSAAQSTTALSLAFTGLTASTAYCAQVINVTSNKNSDVIQANFTTNPSGGGGGGSGAAITGGDDFFAGTGGSNGNSGTSHANRWLDPPSNDSTLGTSADMWFLTGTIYTNKKYSMTRAGTSGNNAENGCYYDDAGTVRKCVSGTHTKPEFRGSLTSSCLAANTCDYRTAALTAANLSSIYDSYVRISDTADYNTLYNIAISKAHAMGLVVEGANTSGSLTNVIIDGVDLTDIGQSAVTLQNGIRDVVYRNGRLDLVGTCAMQRQAGGTNYNDSCPWGSGFPAAIAVVRSDVAKTLIEANTITRVAGEAIDCLQYTSYVVVAGNRWSNVQSTGGYVDSCNNAVYEANIAIGPRGENFGYYDGTGTGFGGSIGMDIEDWQPSNAYSITSNLYRNNLIVGSGYGLQAGISATAVSNGKQMGGWFVGNTVIDSLTWMAYLDPVLTNSGITSLQLSDNAFWMVTTGASSCTRPSSVTDITMSYNHWSTTPSDTDCQGASDSSGALNLSVSSTATWQAYDYASFPTFANAAPQSGGPKDSGTPLSTNVLDETAYGYGYSQKAGVLAGTLTAAEWKCLLCVDALEVTRDVSTPNKGAVE